MPSPAPPLPTAHGPDRETLIRSFAAGDDPCRFLDAAYAHLERAGPDPELTLLMVRRLADLELGGPARELLAPRFGLDAAGVDQAAIAQSLREVPTGRVPWESLTDAFETNLAALTDPRPELELHREDLRRAVRRLQLFRSAAGRLHLSRMSFGGVRQWLPRLAAPPDLDDLDLRPAGSPRDEKPRCPLVVQVALDELVERVMDATAGPPDRARTPVYLLEPEWSSLAAWLHVADRSALLREDRLLVFAGPGAEERLLRTLADAIDLDIPGRLLTTCARPDLLGRLRDALRGASDRRVETHRRSVEAIRQRDATRTLADWGRRLERGGTVVGFASRFTTMLQHSMRDIGHALEDLGFDVRIVMEREPHCQLNGAVLSRALEEHDPVMVVLINHLRGEYAQAFGDVPLLTWVQDPMPNILCAEAGCSVGPRDFVCGYYADRCVDEFGFPEDRFFSAWLPVSTRFFHDGPVDEADLAPYRCDVMYVGHRHAGAEAHRREWHDNLPPEARPLLDDVHRHVVDLFEAGEHLVEPLRLVRELADRHRLDLPDASAEHLANFFAYRLFDILYRRQTLLWAAQWARATGRSMRLYGRGWDEDPDLAPFASGPLEHGPPLHLAYRGATIVLQAMPAGFMHQRSFEALASGSFVLGRYSPHSFYFKSVEDFESCPEDWDELPCAATFFPGLGRITFTGAAQFAALADRYVDDEAARRAVVAEYRPMVLERCTYSGVLRTVVGAMNASLAGRDTLEIARSIRREANRVTRKS